MIFHTSFKKIEKVGYGKFGANIFFSNNIYAMGEYHFVYSIDDDDLDFLTCSDLYNHESEEYKSFIEHVSEKFECDEETAVELICEKLDLMNFLEDQGKEFDYDLSFFIQEIQGDIAHHLGFFGFETKDEQGTVYIVHLTEEKLKLFHCEEV